MAFFFYLVESGSVSIYVLAYALVYALFPSLRGFDEIVYLFFYTRPFLHHVTNDGPYRRLYHDK